MKRIVVDLDGTICSQEKSNRYHLAKVNDKMKKFLSDRWRAGDYIIICTARGMNSCKGNVAEAIKKYAQMTIKWLSKNQIPYNELVFGKPAGDVYIDDKGVNVNDFTKLLDILY